MSNLISYSQKFKTVKSCLKKIESIRWKDGRSVLIADRHERYIITLILSGIGVETVHVFSELL